MISRIMQKICGHYSKEGAEMIMTAYSMAAESLAGMERSNHEPFINHPVKVAEIVCEKVGLMADSVTAVFLHEASRVNRDLIPQMNGKFPGDIIKVAEALNRISEIKPKDTNLEAERYRRLIASYSTDPRVFLIKLADRLEVMRNLYTLPKPAIARKNAETLLLYIPLAHQTGVYSIKSEMEDLWLKYAEPEKYREITNKLKVTEAERERLLKEFVNPLKDRLTKEGIEYTLKARTKSAYSIWCKMQKQGIPFDKVYDVFAIRFIVKADLDKEKDICWNVYSLVTEEYEPDISRLRDWITVPKPNGYQSLHTTVKNKHGNAIEVQIRTERMDNEAEMGIASHWAYKGVKGETGLKDWMDRMHNLINNPQTAELSDQEDQVEAVLQDVFAFTPDGELRQLRAGATVLDFAFEIHSNIGLKCTGGRVNGKMVSIKEKIKTGDVIEIITGRNQTPNADWLDFVVTSKAKSKIRQKLKETENKLAKAGREMLERRLKNWKIALSDELMFQLIRHYKFKTANEFFGAIGGNVIDVADIKAFINQQNADQEREKEDAAKQKTAGTARKEESSDYIEIGGMSQLKNLDYKMAKCCNPVFGDEVFGFVTVKEGIKIHRICCTNAYRLLNNYPHRIQKIRWKNDSQTSSFQTSLKIVVDQESASNAVLAAISPFNASIRSFKIHERASKHDWEMEVVLHVSSNTLLEKIMATVKKLRDVKQITRE